MILRSPQGRGQGKSKKKWNSTLVKSSPLPSTAAEYPAPIVDGLEWPICCTGLVVEMANVCFQS